MQLESVCTRTTAWKEPAAKWRITKARILDWHVAGIQATLPSLPSS